MNKFLTFVLALGLGFVSMTSFALIDNGNFGKTVMLGVNKTFIVQEFATCGDNKPYFLPAACFFSVNGGSLVVTTRVDEKVIKLQHFENYGEGNAIEINSDDIKKYQGKKSISINFRQDPYPDNGRVNSQINCILFSDKINKAKIDTIIVPSKPIK